MTPDERIHKLENQVSAMQEIIMAIILVQDMVQQYRLRKVYPALDEMMKRSGL